MILLKMLPASFGDCLLLAYGEDEPTHHLLIDAGLKGTFDKVLKPLLKMPGQLASLDLVVVTHLDRDHICGMLPLVEQMPDSVQPFDIWFNGYGHLVGDQLGTNDAEVLEKLLIRKALPWNEHFSRHAVVIPTNAKSEVDLPRCKLPGEATITLLSPYWEQLTALAEAWESDELGSWDAGPDEEQMEGEPDDILGKRPPLSGIDVNTVLELAGTSVEEDTAAPNGSSIAFVFEFGGKRILFGADAHPGVLLKSLELLAPGDKPYRVDAFKIPHHGSMNNLSPELLRKLDCPRFLVSTNGSSFGHPHPEAIARILTLSIPRELCFNYRSEYTELWEDKSVREHFGDYKAVLPPAGREGYELEL